MISSPGDRMYNLIVGRRGESELCLKLGWIMPSSGDMMDTVFVGGRSESELRQGMR